MRANEIFTEQELNELHGWRRKLAVGAMALGMSGMTHGQTPQLRTPDDVTLATPSADVQLRTPSPEPTLRKLAPKPRLRTPAPDNVQLRTPDPEPTLRKPDPVGSGNPRI